MKKLIHILIVSIVLLPLFSCKKSTPEPPVVVPDTTKPVITLADPTNNKAYSSGTAIHLQVDLADNIELKSYKVKINKSLKSVETSDWVYENTWTITAGKKSFKVDHSEITIPSTIAGKLVTTGNYDLTIYCTDTSANESATTIAIVINK